MADELTFHLEDFDGPLELLLALVAKHKMDLHHIPILTLIDQYTRTVEAAQAADPEIASAFIEMAAHLVEMKSYLLLPRSEEGERMKQELTGQLSEYEQCRRMAAQLREKAEAAPVFLIYFKVPAASLSAGAGRLLAGPDGAYRSAPDAHAGAV